MKKKTRQVKIKARVMWQLSPRKDQPDTIRPFGWGGTVPVFVLPASAEAYDAMLEQGAKALWAQGNPTCSWCSFGKPWHDSYRDKARAVLSSLGINEPNRPTK